jgi:hypothetical protein
MQVSHKGATVGELISVSYLYAWDGAEHDLEPHEGSGSVEEAGAVPIHHTLLRP